MIKCKICETEFQPKNKKGVFCSAKCRQKDYRKRMSDFIKIARGAKIDILDDLTETAKSEIVKVKIDDLPKVAETGAERIKRIIEEQRQKIRNNQK